MTDRAEQENATLRVERAELLAWCDLNPDWYARTVAEMLRDGSFLTTPDQETPEDVRTATDYSIHDTDSLVLADIRDLLNALLRVRGGYGLTPQEQTALRTTPDQETP